MRTVRKAVLAFERVKKRRRAAPLEEAKRGEMVPEHDYVERKCRPGECVYMYPPQEKNEYR
jgi:hypothetical protein